MQKSWEVEMVNVILFYSLFQILNEPLRPFKVLENAVLMALQDVGCDSLHVWWRGDKVEMVMKWIVVTQMVM